MANLVETRRMQPYLGTFVEVGAAGKTASTSVAIADAFSEIKKVQDLLSFHNAQSELSKLNASPGEWVRLSSTSINVLKLAYAFMIRSDHVFNCTVGGLLMEKGLLPRHSPSAVIPYGSVSDIAISNRSARLNRPICVTLDGIAKGYAVDCAIAALKRHNLGYGWVNAGGDMRVFGERVLPILQRQPDASLLPIGGLKQAALATSTNATPSESFPGLIVNPLDTQLKYGQALQSQAVFSVIARTAWRADALTKVAVLTPAAQRAESIAKLGGYLVEVDSCGV